MPYDLAFERTTQLDNASALQANKLLAGALISAFPEIHDPNAADFSMYFTRVELDPTDEFPENHFRLWAELDEQLFGFAFWQDTLWLELGAARNPITRFAHLRRYAEFITQRGFVISSVSGSATQSLAEGLEEHWGAYKEWVGFVEQVVQAIAIKSHTPQ